MVDLRLVAVQPDVLIVLKMSDFTNIMQLFDANNTVRNSFNSSGRMSNDRRWSEPGPVSSLEH